MKILTLISLELIQFICRLCRILVVEHKGISKEGNWMYRLTDEELTNRINTFLDRKYREFPDTSIENLEPVRKIDVKQRSRSYSVPAIVHASSSIWA